MTAGSRLRIAAIALALALLPGARLLAQNSAANTNGTIGPEQLRDFSLGGNVTRPADPAPEPGTPAPRPRPTPPAPAGNLPTVAVTRQDPPPSTPADTGRAEAAQPSRSVTMELPQAAPFDQPGALAGGAGPSLSSQPGSTPTTLPPVASVPIEDGPSLLPWLAAALALGLAALYYASRKRPGYAAPPAGMNQAPVMGRAPSPAPAATVPAPSPAPGTGPLVGAVTTRMPASDAGRSGVVSMRMRPTLELQLVPTQLIFDGQSAAARFTIRVLNTGNAPARDILVEARLFNASPTQDREIGAFFEHPIGKGERLAEIPAGRNVALASEVMLPVERMRVFDLNGRKLFVPVIAFNALYRWVGGEGQTSASFMLGRDTGGDKMGPFHIELGPRIFRSVAAREQPLRLRK